MTARDVHRIGGRGTDNLRLKPAELRLLPPGISVLRSPTPADAADQMRRAFPAAGLLHELCRLVASSNADLIRQAGFELLAAPTRKFPNHFRIIHASAEAWFDEVALERLSATFIETVGV